MSLFTTHVQQILDMMTTNPLAPKGCLPDLQTIVNEDGKDTQVETAQRISDRWREIANREVRKHAADDTEERRRLIWAADQLDAAIRGDLGPTPVGVTTLHVALAGTLLPMSGGQPVLLRMPGTEDHFLPLFSDVEALRSVLGKAGVPFESIKQVLLPAEFLEGLPHTLAPGVRLRIIFNPEHQPSGRVKFTEIFRTVN